MADSNNNRPPFHDYGIHPDGLPEPPERVICQMSTGTRIGQYLAAGLCVLFMSGAAYLALIWFSSPYNILVVTSILFGVGSLAFSMTRNDYASYEISRTHIRGFHLYTGVANQWEIEDVVEVFTQLNQSTASATWLLRKMIGRIRGVQIFFRHRRFPVAIFRCDPAMKGAQEAIEALLYRLSQRAEMKVEIADSSGNPYVRRVYFEDDPSEKNARLKATNRGLLLSLFSLVTVLFGVSLLIFAEEQTRKCQIFEEPVAEMSVAELAETGPIRGRHVQLKEFKIQGCVFLTGKEQTTLVLPLFPENDTTKEIRVALVSTRIQTEKELAEALNAGPIHGICATSTRRSWGPNEDKLIIAYIPGCVIQKVWEIEETLVPPDKQWIPWQYAGGTILCIAAILMAIISAFLGD